MNRREYLVSAIGVTMTAVAGCSSQEGGTPTETPSHTTTKTTPEPAVFEVVSTTGGSYEGGSDWPLEFTVANRGGERGKFNSTLQVSPTGSNWSNVTEISLAIPPGEKRTFSQELGPLNHTGTINFRLAETDTTWTIEFTEPESDFQGSSTEDRTYVDLQYRDYYDHEADHIKKTARNISYEELNRNVDDLVKESVHFTGEIIQTIPYETHQTFLIKIDGDYNKLTYASWVGDRFIEGDKIEFWGQVLGLEIYETGAGSTNTVPGLVLAAIDLKN